MKWVFPLIIIAILLFVVGCSTISSTSLKEYRVNADSYVGKNITINNRVGEVGSPAVEIIMKYKVSDLYRFVDDAGYFVNAVSTVRVFEKGKFYTVTGVFIKTSYGEYYLIEE